MYSLLLLFLINIQRGIDRQGADLEVAQHRGLEIRESQGLGPTLDQGRMMREIKIPSVLRKNGPETGTIKTGIGTRKKTNTRIRTRMKSGRIGTPSEIGTPKIETGKKRREGKTKIEETTKSAETKTGTQRTGETTGQVETIKTEIYEAMERTKETIGELFLHLLPHPNPSSFPVPLFHPLLVHYCLIYDIHHQYLRLKTRFLLLAITAWLRVAL